MDKKQTSKEMKVDDKFLCKVIQILPNVDIPYFVLEDAEYDRLIEDSHYSSYGKGIICYNGIRLIPRSEYDAEAKYALRLEKLEKQLADMKEKLKGDSS